MTNGSTNDSARRRVGARLRTFSTGLCLIAGLTGCAVVPGGPVVYEDARGYSRAPDVVVIDRGPAVRWPYFYGHRRHWHGHRHRPPHRGERRRGRSGWEGRDGRRGTRPEHGRSRPEHNRPHVRPEPRLGTAVPVMPRKSSRRSEFSDRRGRHPGRTPGGRGAPRSGPPEGESS